MNEEEFKEAVAKILKEQITFAGQIGSYIIHGALEDIYKLHVSESEAERNRLLAECEAAKELLSLIIEDFESEEWIMPKHECEFVEYPEKGVCSTHEAITNTYYKYKKAREERLGGK